MSANCKCGWTGGIHQVGFGGMCPKCFEKVTYDNKPVTAIVSWAAIPHVSEFNRRAAVALNGIDARNQWEADLHQAVKLAQRHGHGLQKADQRALYAHIHRHRNEITDKAVTDYAAVKVAGAD